ncbi:MAG: hypothetical protein ACFE8L_06680 [Candidatus Hodarchaeota archaeon]
MAKLEIRCPSCSARGKIEISEDAIKNVTRGVLAVNIAVGMICEHSFIAYVDRNMQIRDYFMADFQIQIPTTSSETVAEDKIVPETESIDFDLIRINIPAILIAQVIRATFYGKKIIVISDLEFLYNHILNFFRYIMQDSFEIDITIISSEDYKTNKKSYKDFLILKDRNIIQDKDKIIDPKKLEIEKTVSEKFLSEYDLMTGLILIRNEIHKAYKYSKTIAELIKNNKEKVVTSKILVNEIARVHEENIKIPYLKFLIEIVKYYFNVEVPSIDGVTDLLGFL